MADCPPQIVVVPLKNEIDKFLVLVLNPPTNKFSAYKVDATQPNLVPIINAAGALPAGMAAISVPVTLGNIATFP